MSSNKSNFVHSNLKKQLIKKYASHEKDTGSPKVQIALMTARIKYITSHLQKHKKDHASRRGLLQIVGARRRMIKFLEGIEGEEAVKKFLNELENMSLNLQE
ncbi:MAG: 30S ribosomal protein S15 [Candidatus Dojkabacteria bacterium]|nr:30S ribosomal protein S15 [Candidatus Dojkabacteria bacterium]